MSLEQEVELIRQFPIFAKIQPAMQKLLCFSSERLTYAPGADVLPVFSPDGKKMMWSSSRTEDGSTQLYIADWLEK